MNWSDVKHLTVSGKNAVRLSVDGAVFWKGLPKGYRRLDYIEATGTQYIDTGFILNQDSRIVCEYMYKGGDGIFGARSTVATRNFSLRAISGAWQMGYGNGVSSGSLKSDTTKWHIADLNKNTMYIDGELVVTRDYVTFTTPRAMAIGAIRAGSVYYGKGRYRTCQVYDNGVLVRDLMPCRNAEGEIGMYDALNAVFYGNAGSGTFAFGEL